jgi:uncharacterized membrane protein
MDLGGSAPLRTVSGAVPQSVMHGGRKSIFGGEGRPMTIFWIIVVIVALIALFWVISRRRGAA